MSADPYASTSFEAFWPHYVRLHARPETWALHAAGSLAFGALAVVGLARRSPLALALAPLVDHVLAQAGHRVFEGNVTRPWRHPAWHARAEVRMLRLVLSGRMAAEVERHRAG